MYLGQIVEMASTDQIFDHPMHPYTIALLSAVPRVNVDHKVKRIILKGDVPSPVDPKPGCRFAPRCWMSSDNCAGCECGLHEVDPGHFVACPYAAEAQQKLQELTKTQSLTQTE